MIYLKLLKKKNLVAYLVQAKRLANIETRWLDEETKSEMLTRGYSQYEIANTLRTSQPIISRASRE